MTDGSIIWSFYAAASEDLILSNDQVESVYYVPSAPVILNGRLWVSSGRHSYFDNGILVWALDPVTGEIEDKLALDRFNSQTFKRVLDRRVVVTAS